MIDVGHYTDKLEKLKDYMAIWVEQRQAERDNFQCVLQCIMELGILWWQKKNKLTQSFEDYLNNKP